MERIHIRANGENFPVIFKEDINKYFNYLLVWLKDDNCRLEIKKENTIKLLTFISDLMEESEERRGKKRISNLIEYCKDIYSEVKFNQFYYDLLLASEGKSLLTGFGVIHKRFSGDNRQINPEKVSIY